MSAKKSMEDLIKDLRAPLEVRLDDPPLSGKIASSCVRARATRLTREGGVVDRRRRRAGDHVDEGVGHERRRDGQEDAPNPPPVTCAEAPASMRPRLAHERSRPRAFERSWSVLTTVTTIRAGSLTPSKWVTRRSSGG
mgnify:CR=1 FL=1